MRSGGFPENSYTLGVEIEARRIRTHPPDSRFHVLNRRRKLIQRGEPVRDCRGDVATLRQPDTQREEPLTVPCPESAAMHTDDRGMRPACDRTNHVHR